MLYSWRFSSLKNLSPKASSIPALRLGAGVHTLNPSVFLWHSVGLFLWNPVYSAPDSAGNSTIQSLSLELVTGAGCSLLYQRDTRAGRAQLEPLVAKQLLTLISFSTGSRRAANSELLKKIAASLTGFKPSSFTLLPGPDENHYPIELTSGPLEVCQIILTRQLKKKHPSSKNKEQQLSLSVVL